MLISQDGRLCRDKDEELCLSNQPCFCVKCLLNYISAILIGDLCEFYLDDQVKYHKYAEILVPVCWRKTAYIRLNIINLNILSCLL